MTKRAAATIVSRNYMPAAQVLKTSFLKHNPGSDFFILLVDDYDLLDETEQSPIVLDLRSIYLPGFGAFVYRYSIMELNTAVKPFLIQYLIDHRFYDEVLYIDPDIKVFKPLNSIWEGFAHADILLTPHMETPFNDGAHPNELAILQSGTYNLGFIGVKKGPVATAFLRWWQERLYTDCVVDIPAGLFVDQKWIDLAVGYFESIHILRDRTLNVAYWNLHERNITWTGSEYLIDGDKPLSFFHFSGYSPLKPYVLSKHENRHSLEDNKALAKICIEYGDDLLKYGYTDAVSAVYAFDFLPNGVKMARTMRLALLALTRAQVDHPDPYRDSDGFCRFLLTPFDGAMGNQVTPLQKAIFAIRPDVAAAYRKPDFNFDDKGMAEWLRVSGYEEGLDSLLEKFPLESQMNPVLSSFIDFLLFRDDVIRHSGIALADRQCMDNLLLWIENHGCEEYSLTPEIVSRVKSAAPGVRRILNLYFVRYDLRRAFPRLNMANTSLAFRDWLVTNSLSMNFSRDEIEFFYILCRTSQDWLLILSEVNIEIQNDRVNNIMTIYDCRERGVSEAVALELYRLTDEGGQTARKQALVYLQSIKETKTSFVDPEAIAVRAINFGLPALSFLNLRKELSRAASDLHKPEKQRAVNIAGMFMAPTGMGEAARLLHSVIATREQNVERFSIPTTVDEEPFRELPYVFGLPNAFADLSLTLVNADSVSHATNLLPRHYWAKRNIGYWLWETDLLPLKQKVASIRFDEIWTSSEASAGAISRIVDKPVQVLPLPVDFDSINSAKANRPKFGLPEEPVIFAFFFDTKSVLERKNPQFLIDTFEAAFGGDPNYLLLLKVNGEAVNSFDVASLRERANKPYIRWYQKTLSRQDRFDLLHSIDVYCSLHRFEGFGLTCAEAMAAGKAVVASNYSGNIDFMTPDCSCLVPVDVMPTKRRYGPYPAGSMWAEPHQTAAIDIFQSLADASHRLRIGKNARSHVQSLLNKEAIGNTYRMLCEQMAF